MLVAPLFEEITERDVYLPEGKWIDYQTGKVYEEGWHTIEAGEIPIVVLIKDGTVIPHIKLAQSTQAMDWSKLDLKVYAAEGTNTATGKVYLPEGDQVETITVNREGNSFKVSGNPLSGQTTFKITLQR